MDKLLTKKVEKLISEINALVPQCVDNQGEAIAVVIDTQCTIEHEEIVKEIKFTNSRLFITVIDWLGNESTEVVNASNIEFDGVPQLQMIKRAYKKVIKKIQPSTIFSEITLVQEQEPESNSKLFYTKLVENNPTIYATIVNDKGQEIELVEHPFKGGEYPVICICHTLKLASASDFFDCYDMLEPHKECQPYFTNSGSLEYGIN